MSGIYSQDQILEVLKESRHFKQFDTNLLNQLISVSEIRLFNMGDCIIEEQSFNDKVFIIIEGAVGVYSHGLPIIKLRRQGDLVGEMSVISKARTAASVIAETTVLLFTISEKAIRAEENDALSRLLDKVFLDILIEKLTATTAKAKDSEETRKQLAETKETLGQAENTLHERTNILQSILAGMSDGVVVVDENRDILHINDAFRSMLGGGEIPLNLNRWEHMGFFQTDQKSLLAKEDLPMLQALTGQHVDLMEIYIQNQELLEPIWLHASARALARPDGRVYGAVAVFRDYTKKKKEEQALIKAKEMAEAMAKSKSDFLAVMSHELRTPLNGILGMAGLLESTRLSKEQKEAMDTIRTSGEALLIMIKNILDYNSLESGSLTLALQECELVKELQASLQSFQIKAKAKQIAFAFQAQGLSPIQADGRRLVQILDNLVDNAIKFTPQGGVEVTLSLEDRGETHYLVMKVKDTGIGIEKKDMEKIFQTFTQGDSTYARKFDGAGLGLSVTKKLVELMQGSLTVESQPGQGSLFLCRIPVPRPAGAPAPAVQEAAPPLKIGKEFAEAHPLEILVAEDNKANQKLIQMVLKKMGYNPVLVENGREAVEAAQVKQYDLVLMDLQMPEMDGLEASRVIMASPADKKPAIVALTANTSDGIEKTCQDAGMIGFLTKPLRIDLLADCIQNRLG